MALSGGGVRASAFALGALLYLVDSGLNKRVGVISSVSGASLTNGFVLARVDDFGHVDPTGFDAVVRELVKGLSDKPVMGPGILALNLALVLTGCLSVLIAVTGWPFSPSPLFRVSLPVLWGFLFLLRGVPIENLIRKRYLRPPSASSDESVTPVATGPPMLSWKLTLVLIVCLSVLIAVAGWPLRPRIWLFASLAALWGFLFLLRSWINYLIRRRHSRLSSGAVPDVVLGRDRPHGATTHVFCSTDLVTQSPFFLVDHGGLGWMYGPFGWALTDKLRLATAVRASAAMPGAFPPRALWTGRLKFLSSTYTNRRKPLWLHLADGGVWDNLGTQWFHDRGPSRADWEDVTTAVRNAPSAPSGQRDITRLLVVDARGWGSGFTQWNAQWRSLLFRVPLVSELLSLANTSSLLYENTVEPRVRAYLETLRLKMEHPQSKTGSLVCVGTLTEHPFHRTATEAWDAIPEAARSKLEEINGTQWMEAPEVKALPKHLQAVVNYYGEVKRVLEGPLAEPQPKWLSNQNPSSALAISHLWSRCSAVGTKLSALSSFETMALIIHGYVQAMGAAAAIVAIEQGQPDALPMEFPSLDRFERLLDNATPKIARGSRPVDVCQTL